MTSQADASRAALPHVTWLRAFEAAARHSSFSSAAEELHLTPAAVSQQIRLLEQHIGVQLFKRLPRGVELSGQGQAYALPIRKAFQDIQNATAGLFDVSRRRKIHVRASITYGTLVLAPLLPVFQALYPDVEVHLSTAVWSDRMDDGAIDIDIRFGNGDWGERHMVQLGHEVARVICSPAQAEAFGDGLTVQALAADRRVLVLGSEVEWHRLSERFDLSLPASSGITKVDSSLMALQVIAGAEAKAGADTVGTGGAAIMHERFAARYIAQGLVVSPFEYRLPMREAYFLVAQDSAMEREEVRQFRDWLLAETRDPMTP